MFVSHIQVRPLFSSLMVNCAPFDLSGQVCKARTVVLFSPLFFQGHCAMWQHVLRYLQLCVCGWGGGERIDGEREATERASNSRKRNLLLLLVLCLLITASGKEGWGWGGGGTFFTSQLSTYPMDKHANKSFTLKLHFQ